LVLISKGSGMKFCPRCRVFYYHSEKYCETDGSPLLDHSNLRAAALSTSAMRRNVEPAQPKGWLIGGVGICIGVVFLVLIFTARFILPGAEQPGVQDVPAYMTQLGKPQAAQPAAERTPGPAQASILSLPPETLPAAAAPSTAAATASTQAVAEASSKLPIVQPRPVMASLNDGAVSTGLAGKQQAPGRAILHLKDGTNLEVDAAWEDRGGIWYRQGALVSFTERNRIQAITESAVPKESPKAADTPSPAASATPSPGPSPAPSLTP
jgi:hypothetical protein